MNRKKERRIRVGSQEIMKWPCTHLLSLLRYTLTRINRIHTITSPRRSTAAGSKQIQLANSPSSTSREAAVAMEPRISVPWPGAALATRRRSVMTHAALTARPPDLLRVSRNLATSARRFPRQASRHPRSESDTSRSKLLHFTTYMPKTTAMSKIKQHSVMQALWTSLLQSRVSQTYRAGNSLPTVNALTATVDPCGRLNWTIRQSA